MLAQHLSYAEFRQVARLCRSIDLTRLPPGFDFRQYLLRVVRTGAPSAAPAVARLTDEEVELLRGELVEFHALAT